MAAPKAEKTDQPLSLAAKMARIMGEVPTMVKDGQNQQQRYQYTTAEAVKAAIRPLLSKHRIAMFAAITDIQRESAVNKNGTTVVTVLAKMTFRLVDGDSGETFECEWYGEANDYADKAVNKAATAAEKYWLTNTFLLSTSEPEADEETVDTPQAQAEETAIDPELAKLVQRDVNLRDKAKELGISLEEYRMSNVEEARNAYAAHAQAVIEYGKKLVSPTPALTQPEGQKIAEWVAYIRNVQTYVPDEAVAP